MAIDDADLARLKEIFVTKDSCDTKMDAAEDKQTGLEKDIALMKQQMSTIVWVSKTTLGAVLVAIVGAVLKLIITI